MNINKTAAWGWFSFLAVAALVVWIVLTVLVITNAAIIGKYNPATMDPSNFACAQGSCQATDIEGDCILYTYSMYRCQSIGAATLTVASVLTASSLLALGFYMA